MKKIRAVLLLILLSMSSGCVSAPEPFPTRWKDDSKSEYDFFRDNSECMAMSYSAGDANTGGGTCIPLMWYNFDAARRASHDRVMIYEHCMRARGWKKTDVKPK